MLIRLVQSCFEGWGPVHTYRFYTFDLFNVMYEQYHRIVFNPFLHGKIKNGRKTLSVNKA